MSFVGSEGHVFFRPDAQGNARVVLQEPGNPYPVTAVLSGLAPLPEEQPEVQYQIMLTAFDPNASTPDHESDDR
jgi:hypothetical protein